MSERASSSRKGVARRAAEAALSRGEGPAEPAVADPAALLHELQVHQVELEHQNEELRAAQSSLEVARDLYQELYDHAPVGYLTLDAEGRIAAINLTGAAMLGADRAGLLQQPFRRFLAPEGRAGWAAHLERLPRDPTQTVCELPLLPLDRPAFHVQLSCVRAAAGGALRCTLVDVSERHRAEVERDQRLAELALANERLERARQQLLHADKMAAIGQLAAGVAHEMGGPLSYLGSNLRLLGRDAEELAALLRDAAMLEHACQHDCPVHQRLEALWAGHDVARVQREVAEVLGESLQGLDRMTRLVGGLRDFAHPDAGGTVEAELGAVLEVAFRLVHAISGRRFRMLLVPAAAPLPLRCRPHQLEQVLVNLLLNAVQASPPEGVVVARCGQSGAEVWAEVEDHGAGIQPEHLPRLFEPFFTTKPVGAGTGLGLAIAHGIVNGHGGRIEVRSAVGAGATFRVWLPQVPPPGPRRPHAAAKQ